MTDFALVFEKDYQLLQEIQYSVNGSFKKTKDVILKAPTMRNAEKFEIAVRSGLPQLAKFICNNDLMLTRDGASIGAGDIDALHIIAVVKLAEDYINFFFDLDSLRKESPKVIQEQK